MIVIKGKRRGGAQQLAAHLLRRDTNEAVFIREIEGYPALKKTDEYLTCALKSMAAQGLAKGKLRTLYHTVIAPEAGESLNRKQLDYAVDLLARELGMAGHARAVVEHHKDGRQHFHVVFNIVNPKTNKLARLQWSRMIEWRVARKLEIDLGLKPWRGHARSARQWEYQRGKRSGIDPIKVRAEVTEIYRTSKTGKEFVEKLNKAGYVLTRGRNNRYVLVDRAGDIHGLMRRIAGAKLKDLRQKFRDLKDIPLPFLDKVLKERRPKARSMRKAFKEGALEHTKSMRAKKPERSNAITRAIVLPQPSISRFKNNSFTRAEAPLRAATRTRNAANKQNGARIGGNLARPKARKSDLLSATHSAQWKALAAKYAALRHTANEELDDEKRETILAGIEQQEAAESAALAAKQQDETTSDIAAADALIKQQEILSPKTPKH